MLQEARRRGNRQSSYLREFEGPRVLALPVHLDTGK